MCHQVNLSHSSVHVPTDVFDGAEAVINAIDWSRKLEDTFQVCSRFPSCCVFHICKLDISHETQTDKFKYKILKIRVS